MLLTTKVRHEVNTPSKQFIQLWFFVMEILFGSLNLLNHPDVDINSDSTRARFYAHGHIPCTVILSSTCLVAALASITAALPQPVEADKRFSPCPYLFHYDTTDQPGQWIGNLVIQSDDDLHGVWIRLIFDNPIGGVDIDGDYEVVPRNEENGVLIKNGKLLLKAGDQTNVKITVKYDGSKFPQLIEYRLNAKSLCPDPNNGRSDFFQGDARSKDLLKTILSPISPTVKETAYQCGVISPDGSLSYPWHADIFIKHDDTEQYACEATLISPSHLLTAAHCVTFINKNEEVPVNKIAVYLGGSKDALGADRETVAEVKVYHSYDPLTLFNDLAILQLERNVSLTEKVQPICLSDQHNFEGVSSLIGYNIGKREDQVKETRVKWIDSDECQKGLPNWKIY
ncbi:hypothetical protein NQ317_011776 [Molorchus minor]|uniref:Peptidase S1 domain-containing protein n=1 Tax=Molorchus minor TaxID=1323400 RepID=A0ABQ9JJ17_9CUCU|nr:hypothetical protein NQ317_011776 [Molorchus minor]